VAPVQAEPTPAVQPNETTTPPPPAAPKPPRDNGKPKATLNLQNIFKEKQAATAEVKQTEEKKQAPVDRPLSMDEVKQVWMSFAELKKGQIAEYNLLSRDFELNGNMIVLPLNNPVEEPLLQGIRTSLITYLRDKLSNSSINVTGVLQQVEGKKIIYTNKEKFDYLADKNPILKTLQERFGLDPDF